MTSKRFNENGKIGSVGWLACLALVATWVVACAKDPPGPVLGNSGAGAISGSAPFDPGPIVPRNPVAEHGPLQVVGTALMDQNGAPVQLKGASSMWLNWETRRFAESKPALEYARDHWKLSVIRAAMGTEVSGGYLTAKTGMQGRVETIVQNAIDLGIYVIIDWHTGSAQKQTADSVAFFTDMAQKFGTAPNVIYEPFNEPTGVAWPAVKAYHEAVVAAIRAVDPDNVIVLGTPNFSQDVDTASADPVAGTNLMYTLHFYACTHRGTYRDKGDLALSRGVALFITEFGGTPSDGGVPSNHDNNICEAETNAWFSWMSANMISGAAWKLEQCTDSSCILASTAPADGPWTDLDLTNDATGTPIEGGVQGGGHGLLVVNWMRQ